MRFPKLSGLLLTLATLAGSSCSDQEKRIESAQERAESRQIAVISYLGMPRFSGKELLRQITGTNAEMERHDVDEEMLYFTIPEKEYTKKAMNEIVIDPSKVEFGRTNDGKFSGSRMELGGRPWTIQRGYYLFRTPTTNLRVDESDKISLRFGNVTYTQTMDELAEFINNRSIYGGRLNVDIGSDRTGNRIIVSNHGALVGKRESSLTRLVSQIVPEGSSSEVAAQRLLDFVTDNIQYDHSEAYSQRETLKRPNEVLMSGRSDCSGLTILYASLLEQLGIDYRLVYGSGHINVSVAGNFGNQNGMMFRLGDKNYTFAEPTARGFVIGRSMLTEAMDHNSVKQYQKPGKDAPVIDGRTGQPRPFL